jgi:hypothetical protein
VRHLREFEEGFLRNIVRQRRTAARGSNETTDARTMTIVENAQGAKVAVTEFRDQVPVVAPGVAEPLSRREARP